MTDEIVYQEEEQTPKTTYHVQVRLYKGGGPSKDGRRGKIALEDLAAPPEVARWLASPECCRGNKATLYGQLIDVWIDDHKVGDTSVNVPDADAVDDAPPSPPPAPAKREALPQELEIVRLTQYLEGLRENVEAAKQRHDIEIAAYEEEIAKAAEKTAKALEEEESLLEKCKARRTAMHEELQTLSDHRSTMIKALDADSEVYDDLREKLASVENKGLVGQIVDTVDSLAEVVSNEKAMDGLAKVIQAVQLARMAAKGGV